MMQLEPVLYEAFNDVGTAVENKHGTRFNWESPAYQNIGGIYPLNHGREYNLKFADWGIKKTKMGYGMAILYVINSSVSCNILPTPDAYL